MIILNFSHPITKTPALERVTCTALDQITIVDIPVHLDLQEPLTVQVERIVLDEIAQLGGNAKNVDCIRLPGFADAAVLVVATFRETGHIPNIIRFANAGDPRFDAVELLRL